MYEFTYFDFFQIPNKIPRKNKKHSDAGVGKKGDADVHSVAAVADTHNHKRDGDTNVNNLVSSFHFLYEFTVNLNSRYV